MPPAFAQTVGLGMSFVNSLFWCCMLTAGSWAAIGHKDGVRGLLCDMWGASPLRSRGACGKAMLCEAEGEGEEEGGGGRKDNM